MSYNPRIERRYRVYYWSGRFQYYANRLNTISPPTRVRWTSRADEYPDHFSEEEKDSIMEFYKDQYQILKVESVFVTTGVDEDGVVD